MTVSCIFMTLFNAFVNHEQIIQISWKLWLFIKMCRYVDFTHVDYVMYVDFTY